MHESTTAKIIIEVTDEKTAKFLWGLLEEWFRDYVDEKETDKIIDIRME